MITLFVPLNSD